VYAANKTTKLKNKNTTKKIGIMRAASGQQSLSSFRAALSSPFEVYAQSARVPDMYSVPTATRHITRSLTLTTNASGELDIVILPSAFHHAISTRASIVGGSNWSTVDGGVLSGSLAFTTPSFLAQQLVNYRIVGYGVKVYGISSLNTTAGRAVLATVPISSWCNDTASVGGQVSNRVNTFGSPGQTLGAYGVPVASNVVAIQSLSSMPDSMETSLVALCEKPLYVIPKISSPESTMFRQSADFGIGFSITDQTSASYVSSGDASYMRVAGHNAVILTVTGAPASTSVLEVEIIYHLEGNPAQGTAVSSIIGNDAIATHVAPLDYMKIVDQVAKMPTFRMGVQAIGNYIVPGLGTLANRLF